MDTRSQKLSAEVAAAIKQSIEDNMHTFSEKTEGLTTQIAQQTSQIAALEGKLAA